MIGVLGNLHVHDSTIFSALLGRRPSYLSDKENSIRHTTVPVPARQTSVCYKDPLLDYKESDMETSLGMPSKEILLRRLGVLLLMLCVFFIGLICRFSITIPDQIDSAPNLNGTSVIEGTNSSSYDIDFRNRFLNF